MLRPAGKAAKVWNPVECPLQWGLMPETSDASAIVEFGRFRVEPHRRELLADGQPIKLGGRAFDLLIALIEASGAVVSKDVLLDRVWPGRIVEENRLQNQVSALRKAFGADHDLIRTVAGSIQQNGAQFQRCIIGDTEFPIGRDLAFGVLEIAINDCKKAGNLLPAGLMRPKPTVLSPVLQAHARPR